MKIQTSFKCENYKKGKLYLIPTPIGNLGDITFRSVKCLKEDISIILCENTKKTKKLLNFLNIKIKQISFNEYNFERKINKILFYINQGKNVAQVCDSGMPCISDPGLKIVNFFLKMNIYVISFPGPTAFVTALIASGLNTNKFSFNGFLPKKKKKKIKLLNDLKFNEYTQIFYESVYRLKKTIYIIKQIFEFNRKIVICKELTKIYEQYIRCNINEIDKNIFFNNLKGEFCILIEGYKKKKKKLF